MRAVLIILSIGLLLLLVQYSNGAPTRFFRPESEDHDGSEYTSENDLRSIIASNSDNTGEDNDMKVFDDGSNIESESNVTLIENIDDESHGIQSIVETVVEESAQPSERKNEADELIDHPYHFEELSSETVDRNVQDDLSNIDADADEYQKDEMPASDE